MFSLVKPKFILMFNSNSRDLFIVLQTAICPSLVWELGITKHILLRVERSHPIFQDTYYVACHWEWMLQDLFMNRKDSFGWTLIINRSALIPITKSGSYVAMLLDMRKHLVWWGISPPAAWHSLEDCNRRVQIAIMSAFPIWLQIMHICMSAHRNCGNADKQVRRAP